MTNRTPLPTLEHLLSAYTETYAPQNEADATLVRQLALATLRLRRLEAAEEKLWQQDEPDLNQISKFERLRISAESSFYRARKALETLRKLHSKTKPVAAQPEPDNAADEAALQAALDQLAVLCPSAADLPAIYSSSRRSPAHPGNRPSA